MTPTETIEKAKSLLGTSDHFVTDPSILDLIKNYDKNDLITLICIIAKMAYTEV